MSLTISAKLLPYCCLTYQQQIILSVQKIVLPSLRVVIICEDVLMVCP